MMNLLPPVGRRLAPTWASICLLALLSTLPACGGDEAGGDTTVATQDANDASGAIDAIDGSGANDGSGSEDAADTFAADATAEDTSPAEDAAGDATIQDDTATDTGADDTTADDTTADDTTADDTTADDTTADTADTTADTADTDDTTADTTTDDTTADAADTADTASVDVPPPPPIGELVIEDQVLAKDFDTIYAKVANLPPSYTAPGKLRVYFDDGAGKVGLLAGEVAVPFGSPNADLKIVLKAQIVGTKALLGFLVEGNGTAFMGKDGQPLTASFKVTGDTVDPVLTMVSQTLPDNDLQTLSVSFVRVPARFTTGAWLAIYADNDGKIGALLGKEKFAPGDHSGKTVFLTSALIKGQVLHGVLREGAKGSGSWSGSAPVLTDLGGNVVDATFSVDAAPFHPVLEIEDQTLTDPKKLLIKKVIVPPEHFGGWLAIYADDAGKAGALLGKLYFVKGTKENQTLSFTIAQQGDLTLHAVLYAGQKWDDTGVNNVVMTTPKGDPMTMSFKVGAKSLSYIIAKPYTTKDPRHVMVTRAYSYDKPAWVVLARDDNGKPGTVLARKKVLPKFAGNVHFDNLYGDFLENGSLPEFLTGKAGTFRRAVKGDETLHVLLYEDFPSDNKFTYTEGGSEDLPVLDAGGKQVTGKIDVKVVASIQNVQKESERYYFPCPLSQHVDHPTKLPVDCRCHVNIESLDFPECKSDIADGLKMHFGEGPRAKTHNFGGFRSGFTEKASNELIAVMVWKDHKTIWPENKITLDVGVVMGIDMTTRKRRFIGGRYDDPSTGIADLGKGPVLSDPFEVQKGPDGKYYVASYGYVRIEASLVPTVDVIRVDPATGDREYVWRSNHLGLNLDNKPNPYGHCANGRDAKYGYTSVHIGRKGFGIDDKGNFYFSYAHNGNTTTSDGIGIIKVGADGKSCDFVTRHKVGKDNVLYKGVNVGTGFEAQAGPYKGMLVKDGKLYVTAEIPDALIEVDIATGNRKMLHEPGVTSNSNGSSGTHVIWDSHRKLIWQAGLSSMVLMYDPAKGTAEPLWCPQNDRDYLGIPCMHSGAWGNNGLMMERGMWLHPTDPEVLFVVNGPMIQRAHLMSGTSEIFSY